MSRTGQEDCYIGLDLGTSATKGVLCDSAGKVLAAAGSEVSYSHPEEGWVENDAIGWRDGVYKVIRDLSSEARGKIRALAFSAASGNTMLCDAGGRPMTPVINWMDQRCIKTPPKLLRSFSSEEVKSVAGWPCVDSFPIAQIAWFKENCSEKFEDAGRICMNTDWLLHEMSGAWLMDHSSAATFHLQDELKGCYYKPFLDRLGVEEHKLSGLVCSGERAGFVTKAAAGACGLEMDTVIATGSFDHPAAARAMGVFEEGRLMLSCGTSWVGFFPAADRDKVLACCPICDPFLAERGGLWGAIFSVPYIGCNIDRWIKEIIAPGEKDPYAVFNAGAAESGPGAGGLVIDLTQPVCPVNARAADVSRAVMEGAARLLNGQLNEIRQHGFKFKSAVMVGGPAASPVWPSIVGEITGLSITVGPRTAGAQGAAMLARSAVTDVKKG